MEEETCAINLDEIKTLNNAKSECSSSHQTISPKSISQQFVSPKDFENFCQNTTFSIPTRNFFLENSLSMISDLLGMKGIKESGGAKFCTFNEKFSSVNEYEQIVKDINEKKQELPVIIQVLENMHKAQDFKKEFNGFSLESFEYFARYYQFFYKYQTLETTKFENKLIQNEFEYWSLIDNNLPKRQKTSIRMVLDLDSILKSNPNNRYLNVNSVSQSKDSLFQPLKQYPDQISGVTKSWIQICTLFSTKCWSRDGNNLFTLDYLHHGAPKTWYIIGEQYSKDYEAIMKEKYPTLCQKYPKIIFQGLHQTNPLQLLNNNVKYNCPLIVLQIPVFKITQYPGEFVVIFGGSYYCHFSHGFSFSESLNITPNDWISLNSKALDQYQLFNAYEYLIFPIEWLLLQNILNQKQNNYTTQTLNLIHSELNKLVHKEIELRSEVAQKFKIHKTEITTICYDQSICQICQNYSFFSFLQCQKCSTKFCLAKEHSRLICPCNSSLLILYLRYSNKFLNKLFDQKC